MADTDAFAHVEILTPRAKPVRVATLWQSGPSLLAFTRHFGCLLCHEQVAQLRDRLHDIERDGARLRVIGHGNPEHADAFARRMGLKDDAIYTDPGRLLFRALGMTHGLGSTLLSMSAARNGLRALRAGHRQRGTFGDPWQQGGEVVIDRRGDIVYRHLARVAGDHAPVEQLVAAVTRAR